MTELLQTRHWRPQNDAEQLARSLTAEILRAAQSSVASRGAFHLVLAGGNTPRRIYEALSLSNAAWPFWHVYFGDERCLSPDDQERNSRMAADAWLDHVSIPKQQIHPIPSELGAARAAAAYSKILEHLDDFDLVLLGLGEDGHTASLFPGHDWGDAKESPDVMAVFDAPKPPPERVSLSAHRLSAARQVIFMVSGASKQKAVSAWLSGALIPAAAIAPEGGVDILIDMAACPVGAI